MVNSWSTHVSRTRAWLLVTMFTLPLLCRDDKYFHSYNSYCQLFYDSEKFRALLRVSHLLIHCIEGIIEGMILSLLAGGGGRGGGGGGQFIVKTVTYFTWLLSSMVPSLLVEEVIYLVNILMNLQIICSLLPDLIAFHMHFFIKCLANCAVLLLLADLALIL